MICQGLFKKSGLILPSQRTTNFNSENFHALLVKFFFIVFYHGLHGEHGYSHGKELLSTCRLSYQLK